MHHVLLCAGFDMQSIEAVAARYPSARTGMRQQWHHMSIFKLWERSVPDLRVFLLSDILLINNVFRVVTIGKRK